MNKKGLLASAICGFVLVSGVACAQEGGFSEKKKTLLILLNKYKEENKGGKSFSDVFKAVESAETKKEITSKITLLRKKALPKKGKDIFDVIQKFLEDAFGAFKAVADVAVESVEFLEDATEDVVEFAEKLEEEVKDKVEDVVEEVTTLKEEFDKK